jgi:hypothetical protein
LIWRDSHALIGDRDRHLRQDSRLCCLRRRARARNDKNRTESDR